MLWILFAASYLMCALLLWALVHGAAKCRSPETVRALDDEQMRILSEMRKSSR